MNRCQKETSSERYRRKQQELQDKINKMSSEEKIAYENEKRKKQDEANFRHREERRLFKQAKARRIEFKSWKKCAHCGENKLIQDFYSKDEYCKECRNQYYPKKKYVPKYPNNKQRKINRLVDETIANLRQLYKDYDGTDVEFIERITEEGYDKWKEELIQADKEGQEADRLFDLYMGLEPKQKTELQIFKTHVRQNLIKSLKAHQTKKSNKTIEIIGCSFEELKGHLEKTWFKNYGTEYHGEEVHIDHILPLASAKTEEEVFKLCYWTNLQYLLPHDNFTKHDKMPEELEKEHFYENIKKNYQESLEQNDVT